LLTLNTRAQVPVEERSAAAAAVARKDIDKRLAIFDRALADRPYVLGSKPSIVDFHLGAAISWMAFSGVAMDPFPQVRAWLERLQSRPAFAKLRGA
jgi:glutathione S-transferase